MGPAPLLVTLVLACGADQHEPSATQQQHKAAARPRATAPTSPFRYAPTFRDHMPAGTVAVPMLELALPGAAQVKIVAATHRTNADPQISIDLWTFDQRNERGVLEPRGEPIPIFRLDDSADPIDAAAELRRQLATPGTQVNRPVGIETPSPQELLAELHRSAQTARDAKASPDDRTRALALFVQGLDDPLVVERDRTAELLDMFAPAAFTVTTTLTFSEHRVEMAAGDRRFEATHKRGGWALTAVEQAAAPR